MNREIILWTLFILAISILIINKIYLLAGLWVFYVFLIDILRKYQKFSKKFQKVSIILFSLFMLLFLIIPIYSRIFFNLAIVSLLNSYLAGRHLKENKINKKDSLEIKIKKKLKIEFVKQYKKNFPKIFDRVGGFIIPIFPFFSVINKRWNKNIPKEAIIHENVHLHYLLHSPLLIYLLWVLPLLVSIITKFSPFHLLKDNFFIVMVPFYALAFTLFERATFNKTNEIGKSLRVRTRKWNKYLATKYFFIYLIQLSIIFFIVNMLIKVF